MATKKIKFNSTDSFRKRYKQHIEICLRNKRFQNAVKEIREKLDISLSGFKPGEKNYREWLSSVKNWGSETIYKDTKVNKVLQRYANIIFTKPHYLLEWLKILEDNSDNYFDLYFNKDNFVLRPPCIEVYQNYINEKPFVGVFEYILFNKIVVPKSNLIAIKKRDFDEMNYILLAISPNTTKRDVVELWPEISNYQKKMKDYIKNKTRYKKNFTEDLKILKNEKQLKKRISSISSDYIKDAIKAGGIMDTVDELYYNNPKRRKAKENSKNDRKFVADVRKRKSRIKKKITSVGPN